jgi:hypothetical protein
VDKKKKLKSISLLQEPQKPSTAMNAAVELYNTLTPEKQIELYKTLTLEQRIAVIDALFLAAQARMKELEESNAELMEDLTSAERYKIKMEKRRTDHEAEMRRKRGEMSPVQKRYAMGWLESEWQVLEEQTHVVYYHVDSDEQRFDLPDGHIFCEDDGLVWDTNSDQH